jgi:hypothetical protein
MQGVHAGLMISASMMYLAGTACTACICSMYPAVLADTQLQIKAWLPRCVLAQRHAP